MLSVSDGVMMGLNERYDRHLVLPGVGLEGQEKLAAASVLVIGSGGLGSPVLLYLAAAGVGRLGVVDDDTVALSNLQRQIIHSTGAVGEKKVTCLLYTSPSPRDPTSSRMPSSA